MKIDPNIKSGELSFNQTQKTSQKRLNFEGKNYIVQLSRISSEKEASRAFKNISTETAVALAVLFGAGAPSGSVAIRSGRVFTVQENREEPLGEIAGKILDSAKKSGEEALHLEPDNQRLRAALEIVKNAGSSLEQMLSAKHPVNVFSESASSRLPEWNFNKAHYEKIKSGSASKSEMSKILENLKEMQGKFNTWQEHFEKETGIGPGRSDETLDKSLANLKFLDPLQANAVKLKILKDRYYQNILTNSKQLTDGQAQEIRQAIKDINEKILFFDKMTNRFISSRLSEAEFKSMDIIKKRDIEESFKEIAKYYYSNDPEKLIKDEISLIEKQKRISNPASNLISLYEGVHELEEYIDAFGPEKLPFERKEAVQDIIRFMSKKISNHKAVRSYIEKEKKQLEEMAGLYKITISPSRQSILANAASIKQNAAEALKFYSELAKGSPELPLGEKKAAKNAEEYIFNHILKNFLIPKKGHLDLYKGHLNIVLGQNPSDATKQNCAQIIKALEKLIDAFTVIQPEVGKDTLYSLYEKLRQGIGPKDLSAYETIHPLIQMGIDEAENKDTFLKIQSLFEDPEPAAGG